MDLICIIISKGIEYVIFDLTENQILNFKKYNIQFKSLFKFYLIDTKYYM